MSKRLPYIIIAISLLSMAIASVYGAVSLTIPYTAFNTTTRTDYPTGYSKNTWTLALINSLTFNQTTNGYVQIFISNSSSTGYYAINLNLALDTNGYSLDIFVPTKKDPSPSDWQHITMIHNLTFGKTVKISLNDKGYLTIINYVGKTLLDNVDIGEAFVPAYVGVKGSSTNVVLSGEVSIEFSGYQISPTEMVKQWLPIIITFAMFGLALGLLKSKI